MNVQSYRALSDGLQAYGEALVRQKMMERQKQQQDLENTLRQQMIAYQKERDAVGDTRYEDNKTYSRGRDAVADTRYNDQTTYSRGRDAVADTRYEDNKTYGRGRDTLADTRYNDETAYTRGRNAAADARADTQLDLGRMEAVARIAAAGKKDDVMVRQLGDDGQVYSYRIPKKQFDGGGSKPAPKMPTLTREQLLDGVRSGRYTKEQAKQMAAQMGWN